MKAYRIACALLLAGCGIAQAQQPPLNLPAALDQAEKHNLDLTAARARRAVALAGVRIAGQRPNPTVTFVAQRDDPHEEVLLGQSLELGGKRGRRIQLAQEEGRLTDVEILALSRAVRHRARDVFYEAVFARAEVERLRGVQTLAERLQQIAQERFEAGAVAQLEVIQAELEAKRIQADARLAQQREKGAQSRLRSVLNLPAGGEVPLAGTLADPLPGVAMAELLDRAVKSSTELAHIAQEQRVEEYRTQLLRAERVPNLELEFGSDFNKPGEFRAGPKGQLTLALPVFSRNQGQIAQSEANRNFLGAEFAAATRALAARVESAYYELVARQSQVELYAQTLLPAARRVQGLAEESYRAGKTGILNVIEAQRSVQAIEKNYLESLLALQGAFASLEETVGAPIE